jgi:hypothetical protein
VLTGILIFVAGIVIGAVLMLLLQRPRRESGSHQSADRACWPVIAVPLVNGSMPRAALAVAARLSRATHGEVVVLSVVQVPRAIGLDSQSAPGLEPALSRLETAEAIVRGFGAAVHGEVVRVREVGDLVGRACLAAGAGAVVLEPNSGSRATTELMHALTEGKGGGSIDLILAQTGVRDRAFSSAPSRS